MYYFKQYEQHPGEEGWFEYSRAPGGTFPNDGTLDTPAGGTAKPFWME